ncbi:MAG TPA: type II secretion system protein [Chthoniobacterales bacterium]|nr:type II secretion system protein [Chthoniobacterales bacterium]
MRNSNRAEGFRHSGFVFDSSFVIRHSSFSAEGAFTVLELLVVITIIVILAGLILATAGYVEKKGARSRAESEIAAISAALESYKADNGIYPRDTTNNTTDNLDARASGNPTSYQAASLFLYNSLFGATNGSRTPASGARSYFTFKPNMLSPVDQTQSVQYIRDPLGNSYGYSTANQANSSKGYNPTYDVWSTAGVTANPPTSGTDTVTPQWVKNW